MSARKKSGKSRKKKESVRPVYKDKASLTTDEYIRLIEKGRMMLHRYLGAMADETMSASSKECLFRVIEDEYRFRMDTDDEFFERVNRFLFDEKTASDSVTESMFCFDLVKDIKEQGRIREVLAARFPEHYSLPETKKTTRLKSLVSRQH